MTTNRDNERRETYRIPLDAQEAEEVGRFQAEITESQTMRITPEGNISIMPKQAPANAEPAPATESFEQRFARLSGEWRKETRYISSLSKMAMNPNYQRIIGMGERVVPLILREMKDKGGHWLWALHAITGEDPAPEDATFSEAKRAWLKWGADRDLLG